VKYKRSALKTARRDKIKVASGKRKEKMDGTVEELQKARNEFHRPSKIMRGLADSARTPLTPIEDDTSDSTADKEAGIAIQSICNFNRTENKIKDILHKEDSIEELVDPPPAEPLEKNSVASASDMRLALMTMVMEPIEAEAEQKRTLEVLKFFFFFFGLNL